MLLGGALTRIMGVLVSLILLIVLKVVLLLVHRDRGSMSCA
jgi:hypothetical protein